MDPELEVTIRLYFQIWEKALAAFFGWDRAQVADWANQWEESMNDPDSIFFHEDPSYYFVSLLIDDSLKHTSKGWPLKLDNELCDLLSQGVNLYWAAAYYDWEAAKRRVDKVLARYETSLPQR